MSAVSAQKTLILTSCVMVHLVMCWVATDFSCYLYYLYII